MADKRVQVTVSGHVQGVGYRYFAVHAAQRLGLGGTVRNLPDGEVQVISEGDEERINEFLRDLRHGPSAASVTNMQVAWDDPVGGFADFRAVP